MRRSFGFAVVAATVLFTAPASAQDGLTVRVIPRAGMVAPDQYFYEVFANFSGDGPVEWTTGELGRAFVAGLGVEVGLGNDGVLLRGEFLRSFDTWLLATHGIVQPRVLFEPPRVVNTFLDVPMTLTFTSAQVVLPTKLELWRFRPYVLLGVGGKFYRFGEPTSPNDVEAELPSNGFTWGGDLGGGFTFEAFGLSLDIQLRDAITRYWGKTQHDLLVTSAMLWRLW